MTVTYCTAAQVSSDLGLGWDAQQTVGSNTLATTIFAPIGAGRIYSVGDSVRLDNDDGVTEDGTVSAVSYGATYTQLTVGSLTNYASFTTANTTTVQIKSYFTRLSLPTKSEVENWIEESQDEIDLYTKRSWNQSDSSWSGYLQFDPRRLHSLGEPFEWFRVRLPYPDPVTPLTLAGGDSLKVWNGNEETEYVGVKTEGRAQDFWFDGRNYLMVNAERPWPGNHAVYIDYRFGKGTVPKSIQMACTMLTSNRFLKSNIYNNQPMTEGGESSEKWPYSNAQSHSWAKIKGILKEHRRIIMR